MENQYIIASDLVIFSVIKDMLLIRNLLFVKNEVKESIGTNYIKITSTSFCLITYKEFKKLTT